MNTEKVNQFQSIFAKLIPSELNKSKVFLPNQTQKNDQIVSNQTQNSTKCEITTRFKITFEDKTKIPSITSKNNSKVTKKKNNLSDRFKNLKKSQKRNLFGSLIESDDSQSAEENLEPDLASYKEIIKFGKKYPNISDLPKIDPNQHDPMLECAIEHLTKINQHYIGTSFVQKAENILMNSKALCDIQKPSCLSDSFCVTDTYNYTHNYSVWKYLALDEYKNNKTNKNSSINNNNFNNYNTNHQLSFQLPDINLNLDPIDFFETNPFNNLTVEEEDLNNVNPNTDDQFLNIYKSLLDDMNCFPSPISDPSPSLNYPIDDDENSRDIDLIEPSIVSDLNLLVSEDSLSTKQESSILEKDGRFDHYLNKLIDILISSLKLIADLNKQQIDHLIDFLNRSKEEANSSLINNQIDQLNMNKTNSIDLFDPGQLESFKKYLYNFFKKELSSKIFIKSINGKVTNLISSNYIRNLIDCFKIINNKFEIFNQTISNKAFNNFDLNEFKLVLYDVINDVFLNPEYSKIREHLLVENFLKINTTLISLEKSDPNIKDPRINRNLNSEVSLVKISYNQSGEIVRKCSNMEIYNQSRAKRNKYKFQNCYNRILIYNSEQNEIEKNEICCLSNEVVNFDTNTIETINIPITRADSIESTTENNELQMREKVFLISPEVSESKLIGKTNSEIIILDDDSSGLDAQKLNEQSNEPCKNDPIEKVNCLKIENKEKKETYLDDPIQDIKTRESSASSTKVRIDKSQTKIKRKRSRTRSASRSRSRRSRTRSRSRSWNRRRSRSTSRHRDYYKSYANSRYNEYYDYYSYYSYYYPDYYGYDDSDYSRDGVKYKSKTRSKSKSRTKSRSRSRSKRSNRRSRSRSMSRTKNFRS